MMRGAQIAGDLGSPEILFSNVNRIFRDD